MAKTVHIHLPLLPPELFAAGARGTDGAAMPLIVINLGADKKIRKELKSIGAYLYNLGETLSTIQSNQEKHMADNKQDFADLDKQLGDATAELKREIDVLVEGISTGMSQADLDAVKDQLRSRIARLVEIDPNVAPSV